MFCISYLFVGFFLSRLNNTRAVEFIHWYTRRLRSGVRGTVSLPVCLSVFMDVVVSSAINTELINIHELPIIHNYCAMCGIYTVV